MIIICGATIAEVERDLEMAKRAIATGAKVGIGGATIEDVEKAMSMLKGECDMVDPINNPNYIDPDPIDECEDTCPDWEGECCDDCEEEEIIEVDPLTNALLCLASELGLPEEVIKTIIGNHM
jgi:hypothetical protein